MMLVQRKMGNIKHLDFIQCFNEFQCDYFLDFTRALYVPKASLHLKSPSLHAHKPHLTVDWMQCAPQHVCKHLLAPSATPPWSVQTQ